MQNSQPQSIVRLYYLTLLAAVALSAICGCRRAIVPSEENNWWTFTDGSDKPGTGLVLTEKNGTVISGHFFLLVINSSEDDSGRFYRLKNIVQNGNEVSADVNIFNGSAGERGAFEKHRLRLRFDNDLEGHDHVNANFVFDSDADSAAHGERIVFVLQGDQSK